MTAVAVAVSGVRWVDVLLCRRSCRWTYAQLTGDEAIMDKPLKTILLVTLMVTVFAGYVAFQFQR
jgi:hypothetical protein